MQHRAGQQLLLCTHVLVLMISSFFNGRNIRQPHGEVQREASYLHAREVSYAAGLRLQTLYGGVGVGCCVPDTYLRLHIRDTDLILGLNRANGLQAGPIKVLLVFSILNEPGPT